MEADQFMYLLWQLQEHSSTITTLPKELSLSFGTKNFVIISLFMFIFGLWSGIITL
jgi:hypothetical protein